MLQSDKKAYDEAASALERATKLKPGLALAWNRLGRVELRRDHLDRAVEAQQRARKLEPQKRRLRCRSVSRVDGEEGHHASGRRLPGGGGA